MTAKHLGFTEDRYGESMSVGVSGGTIVFDDKILTPSQAAQLALLLIRAYWLAREEDSDDH